MRFADAAARERALRLASCGAVDARAYSGAQQRGGGESDLYEGDDHEVSRRRPRVVHGWAVAGTEKKITHMPSVV